MKLTIKMIPSLLAMALIAGCGRSSVAPVPSSTSVALPAGLFGGDVPEQVETLAQVKPAAKEGDRIVFAARVGGRREAFLGDRAVFFVADPSIKSCDQLHGDTCKTPWDYCCESRDSLAANLATIQVVDEAGRPLKVPIAHESGLDELRTIVVEGVVAQTGDGVFVVNAERIHVREG